MFLGVEHIISHWYKINPWIVVGVFIWVLWLWNFFSLHTKVLDLEIHSDKLERDLNILLVSDIHADYIFSTYHLKTIGKLIEEKHPDIVLIAGDLLNRPHMGYVDAYRYFRDHDFWVPIYAIMGNHDVLGSTDIYSKISEISPIHFLDNESVIVDWIQLVWIIDKSIWWNWDLQNNLEATNMDKSWEFYTIFLTHQPMALEKIKDYPIDLEVAWHTHRGQFYWFRKLVEVMNDYGYWKFEEDWKIAFVTQGIWTWGLPFRLWTQSEAVMIHLKK